MIRSYSVSEAMTQPMVLVQNLTRRFGSLAAADGLSLSVSSGGIFGLLGRNGAGKNTLIKMLTTLLPPTSGSARIAGFDLVTQTSSVRRVIGYVPQALSADGELTGYENLLVFCKLFDVPRRERSTQIDEALEFMGLTDAARLRAVLLAALAVLTAISARLYPNIVT